MTFWLPGIGGINKPFCCCLQFEWHDPVSTHIDLWFPDDKYFVVGVEAELHTVRADHWEKKRRKWD